MFAWSARGRLVKSGEEGSRLVVLLDGGLGGGSGADVGSSSGSSSTRMSSTAGVAFPDDEESSISSIETIARALRKCRMQKAIDRPT